jgi:signal transduction histidine kinase
VWVDLKVENGVARVSVSDRGEGIESEKLPLIWDRYYKAGDFHKRAVCGTGLGLSIVKNALILHGADFGVSSTVGRGSTFWFELKVSSPNA